MIIESFFNKEEYNSVFFLYYLVKFLSKKIVKNINPQSLIFF